MDYIQWQYKTSSALFRKYPDFDVAGRRVLEIGCGTGGRTAFLAALGADSVVGIDINLEEIEVARRLIPVAYPEESRQVKFLASGETERLDIGEFDVVVLVDCLEHVVSPPKMLRLAYDYTRPGGRCYISCIGWYHHHGAHIGLMPFVNVFFSDETILRVVRWRVSRPDYVPTQHDSDPPIERWRGIYDLRDRPDEHLNKLRVSDMKKLVRASIFQNTRLTIHGFAGNRPLLRCVDWLRHVPIAQEVYHSYMVVDGVR